MPEASKSDTPAGRTISPDALHSAKLSLANDMLFADAAELQRVIAETSPDFIMLIALDGTIRYINHVLDEDTAEKIPGTSAFSYVSPEDGARMRECFERVQRTGKLDRYETTYMSRNQGRLYFDCRVAPIMVQDQVVGLTVNASDVTHLKHAEQALREAERNHRALIDQSPVGIISIAPNGSILSANLAFHQMLDYESPDLQGQASLNLLHPDDRASSVQSLAELVSGAKETCKAEKRFRRRDGEYIWTRFSASAIGDEDGAIIRLVCVIEDISERKIADERQKMLMRELDHRVKNNLAALVALTEQSIEASESLEEFETTFIGRVNAMARSHEALANAHWMGLDLHHALSATLAAYLQEKPPRLELDGPDVKLDSRTVMPLCLTMHELATNAMRHGALAKRDGRVRLTWENADGTLHLQWRELGGPAVAGRPSPGVGTSLIDGFVRFELHGTVERRFESDGLVCTITIPLNAGDASPHDAT